MTLRYERSELIVSDQDPFLVVLDWLSFLTAKDYLVDLLQSKHGLSATEARSRAASVIPHIRIASAYIHQSLDGPEEISFLPAYYAILNLLKVYILVGPKHTDLSANRWHGATYDVAGKDSQSVLTEVVTLKKGGVFPLFYASTTGKVLTKSALRLQIKDVLPYVSGIAHEYALAASQRPPICRLSLGYTNVAGAVVPTVTADSPPGAPIPKKNQLKLLKTFKVSPTAANVFLGRPVSPEARDTEARLQLNTYLIYRTNPNYMFTPVCSKRMELLEELPIALLFFYMSSVVRYKPEFFARLKDSKFWPVFASARTHSFHDFLLAFWSFMHQTTYFVNAR